MEDVQQLCRVLRRTGSPVAIKTWILCGSTLSKEKLVLRVLLLNEPLHKISFLQINPNLILDFTQCMLFCLYSPSVGVVGLAEYVCTHPILTFPEEDPDYIPEDNE